MADEHSDEFDSQGFARFFAMLRDELDEPYFALIESHLKALKFKGGMLMSARLTTGNKGTGYTLRQQREQTRLGRMFDRSGYSFTIADRDENGFRALSALEERGVNLVANALAQAVDHVHSFFTMLRVEIGFYLGCVNLAERLAELGEPTAFPVPVAAGELALSAHGLYDVCLRLATSEPVVGNDVEADQKSLVMITGANQGGKSTFLRSVGLAQLMTQAGMFVGAHSLRVNVCDGVFTHYKREEDEALESGKLDEELARMSEIADRITSNCLLLCNESFAATNEREGSEIARQVLMALLETGVKVLFVTHMFDLAEWLSPPRSRGLPVSARGEGIRRRPSVQDLRGRTAAHELWRGLLPEGLWRPISILTRAGAGQTRAGSDLRGRSGRCAPPRRLAADARRRGARMAVGHVWGEHPGYLPARLLRHPTAGAPSAVGVPAPTSRHRILRSVHDVLDDAARAAGDVRRAPLRARAGLCGVERRARIWQRPPGYAVRQESEDGGMSVGVWIGVGLLGGVGALVRFFVDGLVAARVTRDFPLGTFVVNMSGAAILGLLVGLGLTGDGLLLAGTATLGSYTTFSTWMLESQRLVEDGELAIAAGNVLLSLLVGLGAVALGRLIGGHL